MATFSNHSKAILATCDERLQDVFSEVVKHFDCRAISGKRNALEQNELYRTGKSQVKYPDSYHNPEPKSHAIDIVPYPVDWNDRERFTLFAGYVLGVAAMKGIKMAWGGDWDRDTEVSDKNFDDFAHFQIEE